MKTIYDFVFAVPLAGGPQHTVAIDVRLVADPNQFDAAYPQARATASAKAVALGNTLGSGDPQLVSFNDADSVDDVVTLP